MNRMATWNVDRFRVSRNMNCASMTALSCVALMLLLFYPILSLGLAAALLINLPDYTPKHTRRLLAFALLASMSMIVSLRPFGGESDDIASYYSVYQSIAAGDDSEAFFLFGGGIEIALPVVLYFLAILLPDLSPNGLMLFLAFTGSGLFFLWVETAFYSKPGHARGTALMGAALLLLNLFYSTQLVRQFFAMVMLLYAFTAPNVTRRMIYLLIAASFHLTALPFFIAYLLVRRGLIGIFIVLLFVALLRIYFAQALSALDALPPLLVERLVYYVDNNDEYTAADFGALKLLVQLCLISLVAWVWGGFRSRPETRAWHLIPWLASIVHVSLLAIPLVSLRTTLIVHRVASGVIAHKILSNRYPWLHTMIFNTLLLYKFVGYLSMEGSPTSVPTLRLLFDAL